MCKPYGDGRRLRTLYALRRPDDSFVVISLHLLQRKQKTFQLLYIKNKKVKAERKAKHSKFLARRATQRRTHCGRRTTRPRARTPPAGTTSLPSPQDTKPTATPPSAQRSSPTPARFRCLQGADSTLRPARIAFLSTSLTRPGLQADARCFWGTFAGFASPTRSAAAISNRQLG